MPCRPGTRKTTQNHHRMRTSVAVALTDGPVGARIAGVAEGGCHQQANGGCFKIEGGRIAFRTCQRWCSHEQSSTVPTATSHQQCRDSACWNLAWQPCRGGIFYDCSETCCRTQQILVEESIFKVIFRKPKRKLADLQNICILASFLLESQKITRNSIVNQLCISLHKISYISQIDNCPAHEDDHR